MMTTSDSSVFTHASRHRSAPTACRIAAITPA